MAKHRAKALLIMMVLLTVCSCMPSFSKISLPVGWVVPPESLTSADWRNKDSSRYLVVRADFNGDGFIDEARLLVREDNSEMGLFVFLLRADKQYTLFTLDKKTDTIKLKVLGIEVVQAGPYQTACAKGFTECREDMPHEIMLSNGAINYFKYGSANMYYYWDESTRSFKGAVIND